MSRADRFSLEAKKQEVYSDFLNNFDLNPITGRLARVTNEDSVGKALRNITLTMPGERFYDTNKGSKLANSLFQILDLADYEAMKLQLRELYRAYEPRAIIHDIQPYDGLDSNTLGMRIIYSTINIPDVVYTIDLSIRKVR